MGTLRIAFLGKFDVKQKERHVNGVDARKTQELLAYLLLYRERPHCREKLATLLWGESSLSQSKGYLRQALWQLQSALGEDTTLLQIESDWVQIDKAAGFWFDVALFEQLYAKGQEIQGKDLSDEQADALHEGILLYRGDLLENWYQEWCLVERERLQNIYLAMLEKLVGYCDSKQHYDTAADYAARILRCDPAHERTYRRLMRLQYMAGNRTTALRTYKRCVKALSEELGVPPGRRTVALYEQIQADRLRSVPGTWAAEPALLTILERLVHLQGTLLQAQEQVGQEIETVRKALSQ
jgi:DNA-binding SARP family transcriptional activator